MKRNCKQTKGWGFKFIAILSSIMMVINTVTPVVPVFAENETPSNDEVITAENPTPAEETADEVVTADEDTPVVDNNKSGEDADKSADSKENSENTDEENQVSGPNTSDGSDEKENNNTDQSLQNGENSETVETPVDVDKPAENVNLEYVVNAKSTKGISLMNVAPTVASIGDTEYTTLMDAVNAAGVGDTILLIADTEVNNLNIPSDKNLTIDINGRILTLNNNSYYNYIDGILTIKDSGNGKIIAQDMGISPRNTGKLTIENGNFEQGRYLFYLMGGELIISGGNFIGTDNIINCYSDENLALGGKVTINGGNFAVTDTSADYEIAVVMGFENSDITINGGTFNATGDGVSVLIGNGTLNSATKIDSNTHNGKITINDGIFDSITAAGDGEMTIIGGTFNGEFGAYDDSNIEIKGGTFISDPSEYLAEGKKIVYTKDWEYEVVDGENEYENLSLVEVSPDTNTIVGGQNTELTLEVTQNDPSVITGISSEIGTDSGNIAGVVKLTFKDAQNNNLQESVKFNKAVLVKVPVTGTDPVKIRIKHGNENFGIRGLATAPTDCSEGEASDNSKKYDGSAVTPEGGFVNIYICEASEIAAVRLSSSVAELNNTEYGTLEAAVAQAQDGDTVTLLTGITLTDTLIIDRKDIKLDLGGNTLTGASGKKAIFLKKGDLEISNGIIYTDNQAINVCTANVGASNYANLKVDDDATIIGAYAVILREAGYNINATINCGGSGKEGYGATLSISGTLEGNLWIMGNIESGDSKVDISGTIRSENSAGVAQQGYVTVNVHTGAYIYSEGRTAFEQRAGITNIYGGTLKSDATSYVVAPNNNGTTTTGAAFAVSPYNLAIQEVNIYSGTFIAEKALVITNTIPEGLNKVNSVNVEGGIYSGEVVSENTIETNKIENFISGGTFSESVNLDHCAYGFIPKDNGDNTHGVILGYKVTFINEGVEYTGLYIETNNTIAENLVLDPSKTGYTFTGWYDAEIGGNKWIFGTTGTPVNASGTLYAIYEANTYTVHFNSGDATAGSMAEQDFVYDTAQNLTNNGFTKEGYHFVQWTGITLSGNTFTDGEFVKNLSTGEDITLYAEWTANGYTIEYNANSGEGTESTGATYDVDITLSDGIAFSKTGYHFTGWATTSDGTVVYTGGETVKNMTGTENATVILYAVWEANTDTPYKVQHYQQNTGDNNYTLVTTDNLSGTTDQPTAAVTKDYTGFTLSGDIAEYQTAIAGDKTTVVKLYYNRNPHTLAFVVDGVETTGTVVYGADITAPVDPTKDCNSFAGWTSSIDGLTTTGTMPDSDVTFTANWNYTCSRSSGGGGGSSKTSSNDMQEIVLRGEVEVNTGDEAEINTGDENKLDENNDEGKGSIGDTQGYDPELVEAYKWAYKNGITTMPTIEEAKLKDNITRAQLAKMMVMYMSNVLHKQPILTGTFDYPDVNEKALGDLTGYIQLAYQYQIMGIKADGKPLNKFNPRGKVSRAEFATVLSRVLYGSKYNQSGANYYEGHIQALAEAKILKDTNPKIQELRGWIILMLYRSQNGEVENNSDTNPDANTGDTVELTGGVAETQTGTIAETTTGEVVELTGDTVELTGSTAELTGSTQEIEEKDNKNSESLTGTEAAKPSETTSTGDVAE